MGECGLYRTGASYSVHKSVEYRLKQMDGKNMGKFLPRVCIDHIIQSLSDAS